MSVPRDPRRGLIIITVEPHVRFFRRFVIMNHEARGREKEKLFSDSAASLLLFRSPIVSSFERSVRGRKLRRWRPACQCQRQNWTAERNEEKWRKSEPKREMSSPHGQARLISIVRAGYLVPERELERGNENRILPARNMRLMSK